MLEEPKGEDYKNIYNNNIYSKFANSEMKNDDIARIPLPQEDPEVKKNRLIIILLLLAIFVVIIIYMFLYYSYYDQSMDKGVFQFFDLTRGDTELDADLIMEFGGMMVTWFGIWSEDFLISSVIKDYEKSIVYQMFDADSDEKLLENIIKFYKLPEPPDYTHLEDNAVCRFKDIYTLSSNLNQLLETNLEIKDAYVIHHICTFDNGSYEGDFFFYKVGEDWSVMPYLDPLKSVVDGVEKY